MEHRRAFEAQGLRIGCWVRIQRGQHEGRYGRVYTFPGGSEEARTVVGLDGAPQFGSGERATLLIADLKHVDALGKPCSQGRVERWLDA